MKNKISIFFFTGFFLNLTNILLFRKLLLLSNNNSIFIPFYYLFLFTGLYIGIKSKIKYNNIIITNVYLLFLFVSINFDFLIIQYNHFSIFQIIPYYIIVIITFFIIFPNNLYWGLIINKNFNPNDSYKLYIIESTGTILSGIIFYILIYAISDLFFFNTIIIFFLIIFIFAIYKTKKMLIIHYILLSLLTIVYFSNYIKIIQTPYSNIIKIRNDKNFISYYNNKNFITNNEYNYNDFLWVDFCLSSKPSINNLFISGIENPYIIHHLSNFHIKNIIINEPDDKKLKYLIKELNIHYSNNIKINNSSIQTIIREFYKSNNPPDIILLNINKLNNIEDILLLKKIIVTLSKLRSTINYIKLPFENNYLPSIKKAFIQDLSKSIKKYYQHICYINFDFFLIGFTNNNTINFNPTIFSANFKKLSKNKNSKSYLLYNIIFNNQRNKEIQHITTSSITYNFPIKKFILEQNKIYGIFYNILVHNSLLIILLLIYLYFYHIRKLIKKQRKEIYYFIFSSISFLIFILSLLIYKKHNGILAKDIALINTSFFIGLFLALIFQHKKYKKLIFFDITLCFIFFIIFIKINSNIIYLFLLIWGFTHGQTYKLIDNKITTNKISIFSEDYKGTIFASLIASFGIFYTLTFKIDYILALLCLTTVPIIIYKLLKQR